MAVKHKTSLSAGELIREVLLDDPEVHSRVKKIFPVAVDEAKLPYILYRRAALSVRPQKAGQPGADTLQIEVLCFTESYAEGVELAEAVRAALDYKEAVNDAGDMRMRSCTLTDSEEAWQDDAFVQQMIFSVSI